MGFDLAAVEQALATAFVGRRIVYLPATGSTQDDARREAEAGASEGTVLLAEEQTAGRGRFGRAWVSPAGKNLYFTLVLRPGVERLRAMSMIGPLAVCRAAEAVTDVAPSIKWPNDVLLEGRKLAGVLVDSELSGSEVRFVLMGIGVNVNLEIDPASEIGAIATSLRDVAGRDVSREALLAALLNEIETLYGMPAGKVRDLWRARLETLGRRIRLTLRGEVYEGMAEDVDADGNLLLRSDDGRLSAFEAGEVSLRA